MRNEWCIIIAIDGPAASGKGSIARLLAKILNFDYLDTGILYRTVAARMLEAKIGLGDIEEIKKLISKTDFNDNLKLDLHGTLVSKFTPPVAAIPEVRNALLDVQRNFPYGKLGVVIEGRDIGTVIFPKADVKVFITADLEVRAERRFKQLQNAGENIIHDQVLCDLRERDLKDSSRELAPLKLGAPYNVIDTTHITLGESVEKILELIPEVYFKKSK